MKLFDPPCRNTEICPPWKSCLECEWRGCVSSTDALVIIVIACTSALGPDLCSASVRRPSHHISKTKQVRPIVITEYYIEVGTANSIAACHILPTPLRYTFWFQMLKNMSKYYYGFLFNFCVKCNRRNLLLKFNNCRIQTKSLQLIISRIE